MGSAPEGSDPAGAQALVAPARLIASNAGVEGDVIIEKLTGKPFEMGYNAVSLQLILVDHKSGHPACTVLLQRRFVQCCRAHLAGISACSRVYSRQPAALRTLELRAHVTGVVAGAVCTLHLVGCRTKSFHLYAIHGGWHMA